MAASLTLTGLRMTSSDRAKNLCATLTLSRPGLSARVVTAQRRHKKATSNCNKLQGNGAGGDGAVMVFAVVVYRVYKTIGDNAAGQFALGAALLTSTWFVFMQDIIFYAPELLLQALTSNSGCAAARRSDRHQDAELVFAVRVGVGVG
jgi:hypothetical protein